MIDSKLGAFFRSPLGLLVVIGLLALVAILALVFTARVFSDLLNPQPYLF